MGGTLRFSDATGVELSLAGVLGEPAASLVEKAAPIILGVVWDCSVGSLVTLKDCSVKEVHVGSPGVIREEYLADHVFLGAHLEKQEDFSFSHLSLSLSGLSSWADDFTGLSYSHGRADQDSRNDFEIRWNAPKPITGPITGGHFVLSAGAKFSMPRRNWSIAEEVSFRITCDPPQSAEELNKKYAHPLTNLMTLATDHPNALVDFRVRKSNHRDDIHVLTGRVFHDVRTAADLLPHKMLFVMSDIKEMAADMIGRWIEVSDRLSDVCDLYFGIQYKPESFLDTKFLIVLQALELYQRQRHQANGHTGSPSGPFLGEFLTQLMEEHAATVGPLFRAGTEDAVAEWVKHRNYVVHRE